MNTVNTIVPEVTDESLLDVVVRLRQDRDLASRNKNFDFFFQPSMHRALHIHRHLRALERDMLAARGDGQVKVSRRALPYGNSEIRIEIMRPNAKRTAFVSPRELRILSENAEVKDLLAPTAQ